MHAMCQFVVLPPHQVPYPFILTLPLLPSQHLSSHHLSTPLHSSPHLSPPQLSNSSPLHSSPLHYSPHLTSHHITSPHLTYPHLTSPHLTYPHLSSHHLSTPHLTSPILTSTLLTSTLLTSPPHSSPHLSTPIRYVIGSCIKHIPLAGRTITQYIQQLMRERKEPIPAEVCQASCVYLACFHRSILSTCLLSPTMRTLEYFHCHLLLPTFMYF
jgi:hypothetical protein